MLGRCFEDEVSEDQEHSTIRKQACFEVQRSKGLQSLPKSFLAFQHYLSTICLPVLPAIHPEILHHVQNSQSLRGNHCGHCRRIPRSILLAKDIRCGDTTNRSSANNQRTRHRAFHLSNNVVVHIAEDRGNITIRSTDTEEDSSISSSRTRSREAHHSNSKHCRGAVEDEDDAAFVIAVGKPSSQKHPRRCGDVGWECEDL